MYLCANAAFTKINLKKFGLSSINIIWNLHLTQNRTCGVPLCIPDSLQDQPYCRTRHHSLLPDLEETTHFRTQHQSLFLVHHHGLSRLCRR